MTLALSLYTNDTILCWQRTYRRESCLAHCTPRTRKTNKKHTAGNHVHHGGLDLDKITHVEEAAEVVDDLRLACV
jgi:hypothetical protein